MTKSVDDTDGAELNKENAAGKVGSWPTQDSSHRGDRGFVSTSNNACQKMTVFGVCRTSQSCISPCCAHLLVTLLLIRTPNKAHSRRRQPRTRSPGRKLTEGCSSAGSGSTGGRSFFRLVYAAAFATSQDVSTLAPFEPDWGPNGVNRPASPSALGRLCFVRAAL